MIGHRALLFSGVQIWQNLSLDLKQKKSLSKVKVKLIILSHIRVTQKNTKLRTRKKRINKYLRDREAAKEPYSHRVMQPPLKDKFSVH